jgi:hypothetical protein
MSRSARFFTIVFVFASLAAPAALHAAGILIDPSGRSLAAPRHSISSGDIGGNLGAKPASRQARGGR